MATRRFRLRDEQAAELERAFLQEKDGPTRTRYQVVRHYGTGYALDEVRAITGCSRTSLFDWCRAYREGDPEALLDKRAGGNSRKLAREQIRDLRRRLERYRPLDLFGKETGRYWSAGALRRTVEAWYGAKYKQAASYQQVFRRCGFSYQRPAKVYKSRREEDALQRVWAPRGQTPVVLASPSREKTNFYGTLDLSTGEVIATTRRR